MVHLSSSRLLRLLTLAACAVAAPAWANPTVAARVDAYMRVWVKLDRFSGSVLVARDGKVLISRGYGNADAEWNVANAPNTRFRIASLTKQFTATAVLLLQQRGKLDVQQSVCAYVPDCPAAWKDVTLHDLLTHSSGIPDYTELPDYARTRALPATPAELIERFKHLPLEFKPGSQFRYSNSGYVLLGAVIERVSGMRYADFLRQAIFQPLGMRDSGYDDNAEVLVRRASGYTQDGHRLLNAPYVDMTVPFSAGGLYSTVEDLLKWDEALYTDRLLAASARQAMFTPAFSSIGYGWVIGKQWGRPRLWHEGKIHGFASNLARYPQDRVLVVVLSNLDTAPLSAISNDVSAIVFGQPYELPGPRRVIHLAPEAMSRYVGRYAVEQVKDAVIEISTRGDALLCQVPGHLFSLEPESPRTFSNEDGTAKVVFELGRDGTPTGLTFNGQFTAHRVR